MVEDTLLLVFLRKNNVQDFQNLKEVISGDLPLLFVVHPDESVSHFLFDLVLDLLQFNLA